MSENVGARERLRNTPGSFAIDATATVRCVIMR
jgi:hypothetical protein